MTGYAWVALALFALHLLLDRAAVLPPAASGHLFQLAIMGVALAAVVRRRSRVSGPARLLWALFGWAITMQVAWATLALLGTVWPASARTLALLGEVASALYTIPCMYLISSALGGHEPRLVKALDAGTSVLLAVLLGLLIAKVMEGSADASGMSGARLAIWHADAIDFSLALLATLRLFGARTIARRHVYWVVSAFLWINAIGAAIYNRQDPATAPAWWSGLLIEGVFVLLAALAAWPVPTWLRRYRPTRRAARVIAAFAPVAISLGVLLLGLSLSRLNFLAGSASVMLAAILYGLRVALVQTRHQDLRAQAASDNRLLQVKLGLDPLTGIANRGALDARVREILASGMSCSLMMIDVDHFKQFNDSQGHLRGDQCLIRVAAALKGCLQRTDELVARYGGEEFAAVMPAASAAETEAMARRLLAAVSGLRIAHPAAPLGHVTVSIGLAIRAHDWLDEGDTTLSLFHEADQALYQAKADGRNRIHPAGAARQMALGA